MTTSLISPTYRRTPQAPLASGFGPATTAVEALAGRDLHGMTAIVTGGYSGLGLETTRVLAQAGAHVVVPARTLDKAKAALAGLQSVEVATLDLLDPASIDRFANDFVASGRPLNILVNSAGIMAAPLTREARGYESQFAANHLGHYQLTLRLWPALQRGALLGSAARVVSVSSRGHRICNVDFDDPHFMRRPYDRWQAYGQSKTANALFAVALDARGRQRDVRAFSLHPGSILTDLARHLSDDDLRAMGVEAGSQPGHVPEGRAAGRGGDFKTVAQGAATSVWCAASTQLEGSGGVYCEDVDIAPVLPADAPNSATGVRPWAMDVEGAERLWRMSEEMTGLAWA